MHEVSIDTTKAAPLTVRPDVASARQLAWPSSRSATTGATRDAARHATARPPIWCGEVRRRGGVLVRCGGGGAWCGGEVACGGGEVWT